MVAKWVNKTGKCRKQLHVLEEVGRTKSGACIPCTRERDKERSKLRDHTEYYNRSRGRILAQRKVARESKPAPTPPVWTPSPEPYVPGHACSIDEKVKGGKCGCGERWRGTREQIKELHKEHIRNVLSNR